MRKAHGTKEQQKLDGGSFSALAEIGLKFLSAVNAGGLNITEESKTKHVFTK